MKLSVFATAPVVNEGKTKAPGSTGVKQQSRVGRAVDREIPVPEQPHVTGKVGPCRTAIAREGTGDQFGAALERALAAERPVIIDVVTDIEAMAPLAVV